MKHGVVFTASAMNQQVREMGTSEAGKTMWMTTIDFVYRFTDIEDGSHVEGTMIGCGSDRQDKGAYKAITGALKYALTSTFIIPTGDDPESEDGTRQEKKQEATHKGKESTTIGAPAGVALQGGLRSSDPGIALQTGTNEAISLAKIIADINLDVIPAPEIAFVNETIIRMKKYGDNIKMSDKQMRWLKSIRDRCIEAGQATDDPVDNYTA